MSTQPVIVSLYTPALDATIGFYTRVLGFEKTGVYRNEHGASVWAELTRGAATVWFFTDRIEHDTPVCSGQLVLFVDSVDALAASFGDDVVVDWGPQTAGYGLRELGIRDNNGYRLVLTEAPADEA